MDEEIPSSPNACNESQIRRKLVNSETKYVMRRKRTANDPAKKKTFQQTLQRTSQSADLQESSTPSASGLVASVNLSVSLINNEVSGSDQNRRQNESSTLYHQHSHPTNTEDLFNSDSTKTECFYTANIDPVSI